MIQDLSSKLNDIDNKLEKLQKDMDEIWNILDEMKSDILKDYQKSNPKKRIKQENKIIVVDDRTKWRREIYRQIRILVDMEYIFRKRSEVLHYIYNYMRRNYGIVWEQDIKEYKDRLGIDYKPKTIDVVYDNKTYKSIFEAILTDTIANSQCKTEETFSGIK